MLEMWSYLGYGLLALFVLFATGMLNPILHRIFDDRHFGGLELVALLSWRENLNQDQKAILDKQLDMLNLVQKGAGGAKVAAYYKGKQQVPLFQNIRENLKIATVEFSDFEKPQSTPLRANIFLHAGRIFSVEYPKPPARFAKKHGLKLENFRVTDLIIHESP